MCPLQTSLINQEQLSFLLSLRHGLRILLNPAPQEAMTMKRRWHESICHFYFSDSEEAKVRKSSASFLQGQESRDILPRTVALMPVTGQRLLMLPSKEQAGSDDHLQKGEHCMGFHWGPRHGGPGLGRPIPRVHPFCLSYLHLKLVLQLECWPPVCYRRDRAGHHPEVLSGDSWPCMVAPCLVSPPPTLPQLACLGPCL